jgi:Spy/CpxP family protein refolding chaperone
VTSTQWKAIAALLGVFISGGVAGIGGTLAFVAKERAEMHAFDFGRRGNYPVQALGRHLGLSDEQRKKVEAILEEHASTRRQTMQDVLERCGASVSEEKAKLDAEIRTVLTPEQQKVFDELSKRQHERLFSPHGPGMGRGRGRGMF